jgi:hypothetical protein
MWSSLAACSLAHRDTETTHGGGGQNMCSRTAHLAPRVTSPSHGGYHPNPAEERRNQVRLTCQPKRINRLAAG